ncbi:serine/threonine protein kinase [Streptomyces sp. 8K308]|nr:serine/threonine protein kinase [Streptomyces sp. 8K308]
MGKVYLARTPGGRAVAIKAIRPELAADPEFRRRFQQEVRAAERVQGLYTAPVVDSDTEGPRPWLATAYVAGPSLHTVVRSHGPLPVPTTAWVLAGIAEALQAIHRAGVIHRDLKPSNVLLAADGPRVIDFGIARAADATSLTRSGVTAGTPAFMAPEQAMSMPSTPALDVFALGLIAAYVTGGGPPFGEGSSPAVLYRVVHEEPDLSGLPDGLRELTLRCLAKDPTQRPSPAEVIASCQRLAADHPPPTGEWLPPAVAAEIDNHRTARDTAPAAQPAPTPYPPGPYPTSGPAPTTVPTTEPRRRRGGRQAVLLASVAALCVALVGGVIGVTLLNGDGATTEQSDDGEATGEATPSPTAPEPTAESTTEPEGAPGPAVYEGVDIPGGHFVWLHDDPPRPEDAVEGVHYEGDFGFSHDGRLGAGVEGTSMVLLEEGESATLDTCRSVTRFTGNIPRNNAPGGSEICVLTEAGDIGLVTVRGYAPADSPSSYVTVDLTVWRGAAQPD